MGRKTKAVLLTIFIVLFCAIFFSALLGPKEGLLPGLIIGLIIGGVIFVALYFLFGGAMKDTMADWVADIKARPVKRNNLLLVSSLFIIIGAGATYTRITYQLFPAFIVSIVLSILICFIISYLSADINKSNRKGDFIGSGTGILLLLIPFSILYFFLTIILFGFNLEKIKNLF